MRVLRFALLLLVALLVAAGCGGDDAADDGSGTPDGRPAFDASRIPYGAPGVIVRLDDERLDASAEVLRRVSGFRAAEDSLPPRDAVLRGALDLAGIDVPADVSFDGWAGDEAGAARTDDGWAAWVRIRDGEEAAAEDIASVADGFVAEVRGDMLLLADDDAAIDALEDLPEDETLADHRRWRQLEDARTRSGALVAGTDGDTILVAGSDDDGLWLDGRGSDEDGCDQASGDQLDELERLPVGTTLATSGVAPAQLLALIKDALVASEPLRSGLPDDGVVARVVTGIDRAVPAAGFAIAKAGGKTGVLGLSDVGGTKPALVAPGGDDSGTLAADPGYAATRALVDEDERITAAVWIDPLRIVRALGEEQLEGIEGSVVAALGDGIDGGLAWRSCADHLGARIAIAD